MPCAGLPMVHGQLRPITMYVISQSPQFVDRVRYGCLKAFPFELQEAKGPEKWRSKAGGGEARTESHKLEKST